MTDRVGQIWSFGNRFTFPHRTYVIVITSDTTCARHEVVSLRTGDVLVWYEENGFKSWEANESFTRHA